MKPRKNASKVSKEDLAVYNAQLTKLLKFTYLYLLIRFKLHYRQVSIITHTDFDGAVSAAILLQKYPYAKVHYASPRSLYIALYTVRRERAPDIPHDIFILDISYDVNYVTRLVKAIQDTRRECLTEVIWIDHHEATTLGSETIRQYAKVCVYPECPHTAYLVQRFLYETNSLSEEEYHHMNLLLTILENAKTEFGNYWVSVLREAVQSVQRCDSMEQVLRAVARFDRNEVTNALYARGMEKKASPPQIDLPVYYTQQGYKFLIYPFKGDGELYAKVRELMGRYELDFLLVSFQDGTMSAYKNQRSAISLIPLFTLVSGKGHDYAFHFTPQVRITDEFVRPLNLTDLLAKVQEVL